MKQPAKWICIYLIAFLVVGIVLSELKYFDLQLPLGRSRDVKEQSHTLPERPTSAACHKNKPSDTFQICDKLPFTRMECGESSKDEIGNFVVPNRIVYVWSGMKSMEFFQYLSIRSAAAVQKPEAIMFYYTDAKPRGELWDRVEREVPCLHTQKIEKPNSFQGIRIPDEVKVTDVIRLQILLENGGIYLDTDVLVLRSLDPLRKHSMTMGRSLSGQLSSGTILTEPDSPFMREWISSKAGSLSDFFVYETMRLHLERPDLPLHIEDTSMQRPNPHFGHETNMLREAFNISNNYILHIHPTKSMDRVTRMLKENDLRILDTTYGAAARAALFGTQDLIFLKSEENRARSRVKAKEVKKFDRLV